MDRIDATLDEDTMDALEDIAEELGISYTETLRRSIQLYAHLRHVQNKGKRIVIHGRIKSVEVTLL